MQYRFAVKKNAVVLLLEGYILEKKQIFVLSQFDPKDRGVCRQNLKKQGLKMWKKGCEL